MGSPQKDRRDLDRYRDVLAPHNIPYRIKLLSQALERRFQAILDPYDLTPFHWGVLCCLWQEDGLPTLNIGERLRQLGGTLTGVLDGMEKRDLIRRVRDTQDRRVYRVWLTPTGDGLQDELLPKVKSLTDSIFSGLKPEETTLFSEMLSRLDETNR